MELDGQEGQRDDGRIGKLRKEKVKIDLGRYLYISSAVVATIPYLPLPYLTYLPTLSRRAIAVVAAVVFVILIPHVVDHRIPRQAPRLPQCM